MSWDDGTFQPWMNVMASFVRFSFQGYLELPAKWGLCVAVCWRTPCYPHLDLGLNKTTIGSVFVGFISFPYGTHLTVLSTLWILSLPLPLKTIGHFLSPPPAPLPSHPSFSTPPPNPTLLKLTSNWLTTFSFAFFPSFLPSFFLSFFVFCLFFGSPTNFQLYRWDFLV